MPPLHAVTLAVHITIAICGAGHVAANELAKAKAIAAGVYRHSGVDVEWIEACSDGRFAVDLLATDGADPGVAAIDAALGYAQSGTRVATVLYDRVERFAHRYRVKREVLLGYAMAHEIGHLLLPPNSHSMSGVMRASLDIEHAAARRLWFTQEQGALIARRVENASRTVATN
jgi:hypothetical protein